MKKNYEVLVKAYATVVVIGAESEEDAINSVTEDLSSGDLEVEELELTGPPIPDVLLDASKRHADHVIVKD